MAEVWEQLPRGWRNLGIYELRDLVRRLPGKPPYLEYQRKKRLVAWIEQNIDVERCPTCGHPI